MYRYEKIVEEILLRIEQGCYTKKLPSIRNLMSHYSVSQSTIMQSLNVLKSLNKIYSKQNDGYYIIPTEIKTISPNSYDFSTTSTSWTNFPLDNYIQCLEPAINNKRENLFEYGKAEGDSKLISLIQHLLSEEHIYTDKNQIVITSGTQQALHILSLIILKSNYGLLIEQPTYHLLIDLAEQLMIPIHTFKRLLNEFDINEFEQAIINYSPKFVYLMPRLHNPLGTSLTHADKQKIVKLAETHNFYIIEDDYMGDFDNYSKYHTLYELDNNDRVIYLKSFSKIMFPGQRLGISIIPIKLLDQYLQLKKVTDIQTNTLSQSIMEVFIESGLYSHHKSKIIEFHHKKAKALTEALNNHMNNFKYNKNHQMHTVIQLPKEVNMNKLHRELQNEGIYVDEYQNNYINNYQYKEKFLKLNTTNINEDKINEGILKVKDIIMRSTSY